MPLDLFLNPGRLDKNDTEVRYQCATTALPLRYLLADSRLHTGTSRFCCPKFSKSKPRARPGADPCSGLDHRLI